MLLAVLGGVFLLLLGACQPANPTVSLHGETMGTTYSVVISDSREPLDASHLKTKVDSLLEAVNDVMSTYRPDSELSRLNAAPVDTPVAVSPELLGVLSAAQQISKETQGRYDVTVGPLVNLWGFGPGKFRDEPPVESELAKARARVGYQQLEVDVAAARVSKHLPGLYVDLSSIAKGYGVDRVAALLEQQGATAYLVEIGGEVRARGKSPRGDDWKIGIEKPQPGGRAVQMIVPLRDRAVATSGDYRNYFEKDGIRYSHTIDATTGRPITHRLVSVSVLAADAMTADAWATALDVLGEVEGVELAESKGLAAYFIYRQGEEFKTIMTPEFARQTGLSQPAGAGQGVE